MPLSICQVRRETPFGNDNAKCNAMSISYIHTTTNRACPRCGSVNIVIDVTCVWDVESQQWEMDGDPDEHGGSMTCADCSSDHWFLDHPKIIKWET